MANDQTLQQSLQLRREMLDELTGFRSRNAKVSADRFDDIASRYQSLGDTLSDMPEEAVVQLVTEVLQIAALLSRWAGAVILAEPNAVDALNAARARASLLAADNPPSPTLPSYPLLVAWVKEVATVELATLEPLIRSLTSIPLPILYFSNGQRPKPGGSQAEPTIGSDRLDPPGPVAAKILFYVDGDVWTTPQAVTVGIQHELSISVDLLTWPSGCDHLEIDYVTTLDKQSHWIFPFKIVLQRDVKQYGSQGVFVVREPQSFGSKPAVVHVRARFTGADQQVDCTILGHTELRFRALTKDSYPELTGYPFVDMRLMDVIEEVRRDLPGLAKQDRDDFYRCLVFFSKYTANAQQSGRFKGHKILEKDFQQDVMALIRMTPWGHEVVEGEAIGGGKGDLRYRNIIIELKVENTLSDRQALVTRYVKQPTQYSAPFAPVAITVILDTVEKKNPPAHVANNIFLVQPDLHGFEQSPAPFPTKVAVLIIDGNLKSPSDYSR